MKTATTTFLAVIMLTFVAPHMNAQWSFNIQNAFPAEDTYASVSLPAKQLPDIISDNIQGMDDKDVCLHVDPRTRGGFKESQIFAGPAQKEAGLKPLEDDAPLSKRRNREGALSLQGK